MVPSLSLRMGWMALALLAPLMAKADDTQSPEYKRGRLLFIQCRACHDLQPSAVDKVGPNLAGLIGRRAGQVPEFAYSAALSGSKMVWDLATLDRWIEKPGAVIPGNAMAFAGMANAADRAALIRYIEIDSAPR
ncbi:MAG: c-type cytochrome [Gammaproteobacteria bacterium]